jgi:hypothetical protein
MLRNGFTWMVAVLLFCSGIAWAQFFPNSEFWVSKFDFKLSDWFGAVSAVATTVAAIAAWRAASNAQMQAAESAHQNRWQMYRMHHESFLEMLIGAESDLGVRFFRKEELYDVMFPDNRDIRKPFNATGSDEVRAWQKSFTKLADFLCDLNAVGDRDIEKWMGDYAWLSGHMRYGFLKDSYQVYLSDSLPSGISENNFQEVIPIMSDVLGRLSNFSYLKFLSGHRGIVFERKIAIGSFINGVRSHKLRGHTYKLK